MTAAGVTGIYYGGSRQGQTRLHKAQRSLKQTVDIVVGGQTANAALPTCLPTGDGPSYYEGPSGLSADGTGGCGGMASGQDQRERFWFGKRLAILSIAMGSFVPYFAVHYLASYYLWQLTGVQTTEYMHSTVGASTVGIVLTFFCYVRLMRGFAGCKDNLVVIIGRAFLVLGTIGLPCFVALHILVWASLAD